MLFFKSISNKPCDKSLSTPGAFFAQASAPLVLRGCRGSSVKAPNDHRIPPPMETSGYQASAKLDKI